MKQHEDYLIEENEQLRAQAEKLADALKLADLMLSGANMDADHVQKKVREALTEWESSHE